MSVSLQMTMIKLTIHEREFADDDDEICEADLVTSVRVTPDYGCLHHSIHRKTFKTIDI